MHFINAKKVHAIMSASARLLNTSQLSLYEEWGWDLYVKFTTAYNAFLIAAECAEEVFPKINISEEHKAVVISVLNQRMKIKPKKVRADFALCVTSI